MQDTTGWLAARLPVLFQRWSAQLGIIHVCFLQHTQAQACMPSGLARTHNRACRVGSALNTAAHQAAVTRVRWDGVGMWHAPQHHKTW